LGRSGRSSFALVGRGGLRGFGRGFDGDGVGVGHLWEREIEEGGRRGGSGLEGERERKGGKERSKLAGLLAQFLWAFSYVVVIFGTRRFVEGRAQIPISRTT